MEKKPLVKTKTFWAGIGAILAGVAGWQTGQVEFADALQTTLVGLIGIFLRQGMPK